MAGHPRSEERDAENRHEFLCVKTSDRLTGKFAERYANERWWYNEPWNHGVNVVGRAITLFPKQLFGMNGTRDLYKKFVTVSDDDKDRALSVRRPSRAGAGEYDTVLYDSSTGERALPWARMEQSPQVVKSLVTADMLGMITETMGLTEKVSDDRANSAGFMTAISDAAPENSSVNLNTKDISQLREGSPSAKDFGIPN
ncbi:hypothetical protein N7470_000335 [Penicillium chermesinum]|nr:hypothetical protein N7470_000335 [Penicillium chermesinum]